MWDIVSTEFLWVLSVQVSKKTTTKKQKARASNKTKKRRRMKKGTAYDTFLYGLSHHKRKVCWSYDVLITSRMLAFLCEELIKKKTKKILLMRRAVSLVVCSFSCCVSPFFISSLMFDFSIKLSAFIWLCWSFFLGASKKIPAKKPRTQPNKRMSSKDNTGKGNLLIEFSIII